jgi:hypothetical protein
VFFSESNERVSSNIFWIEANSKKEIKLSAKISQRIPKISLPQGTIPLRGED